MQIMRLDKYLTDCGIESRSNCKKLIKQGRVFINDTVIKDSSVHINENDIITIDGKIIQLQKNIYYMFHKPAGCVCATKDNLNKTVLEYFPKEIRHRLLIVGRLDKDTEGLLFITDDGRFIHELMSPKKHVSKTYYFIANHELVEDATKRVAEGIDIGDETKTKPGKLEILSSNNGRIEGMLTLCEGRFHQVKRMIKALGAEVTYLKRIAIGSVCLDDSIAPGEYRELTTIERGNLCHFYQ